MPPRIARRQVKTQQDQADARLLLDLEDTSRADPVLDLEQVFGNANPVQIELGIGKGRFLIDAAQRHPHINYLGVDWANKYVKIAHHRCIKRNLGNVRLVRADAREFVEFFLLSGSVQAVHVYFPDPWPKKRHHKRRLINQTFLADVVRILEPSGQLWLATDHAEYFQVMVEALKACAGLSETAADWDGVRTNYEEKFRARGLPIHRIVAQTPLPERCASGTQSPRRYPIKNK